MGNDQPKKFKPSKGQIDIACLKAKIHLQLYRDRKNNQIIKGQKQLVAKLQAASRNKIQQILIAQRITTGLKQAQACNLLISCAVSLRSHALFIADNQDNLQKIQPWLAFIYSLIYAAQHLGLSSLNEFKIVMQSINTQQAITKYCNPQIIQLLTPSPSPQQLNLYILQMSERNGISLEQINSIGHNFTKDFKPPPSIQQLEMQKQIAQQFKKQFQNQNNQGWNGGQNQGWNAGQNNHNQGFNGGFNGQGNQGFNGGFNGQGNQGFNGGFNGQGNQGFNGGFNGQGNQGFNGGFNGQGNQGFNGGFGGNPYSTNPYQQGSKLQAHKPVVDIVPKINMVQTIKPNQNNPKPKQFANLDDIKLPQTQINPVYPSIDPTTFKNSPYVPPTKNNPLDNPFQRNSVSNINNQGPNTSPTLSQILKDFK